DPQRPVVRIPERIAAKQLAGDHMLIERAGQLSRPWQHSASLRCRDHDPNHISGVREPAGWVPGYGSSGLATLARKSGSDEPAADTSSRYGRLNTMGGPVTRAADGMTTTEVAALATVPCASTRSVAACSTSPSEAASGLMAEKSAAPLNATPIPS